MMTHPAFESSSTTVTLFGVVRAADLERWQSYFGPDGTQEVAARFKPYKIAFFTDENIRQAIPPAIWREANAEGNDFVAFRDVFFKSPMTPYFGWVLNAFVFSPERRALLESLRGSFFLSYCAIAAKTIALAGAGQAHAAYN